MIERPWGLVGAGNGSEESEVDLQVFVLEAEWMVPLPNNVGNRGKCQVLRSNVV